MQCSARTEQGLNNRHRERERPGHSIISGMENWWRKYARSRTFHAVPAYTVLIPSVSMFQEVEHCYYHGKVKDFGGGEYIPGSMAALQTCNGVSGVVHLGNETLVIHPFFGGDLSSKHPHVIYEYSGKSMQGCGLGGTYDSRGKRSSSPVLEMPEMLKKVRETRDVRAVRKFIEVALVLDKAMVSVLAQKMGPRLLFKPWRNGERDLLRRPILLVINLTVRSSLIFSSLTSVPNRPAKM